MIQGIKQRILLVEALNGEVSIAHEEEQTVLANTDPVKMPSVLLWYGRNQYVDNENPARVRQFVGKQVIAGLFCLTAELDDLEKAIVQACLGYKKDPSWDLPLVATESVTFRVTGEYTVRRIGFVLQSRVVQTPL